MTYRDEAFLGKPISAFIIDAHTHMTEDYARGWHQMKSKTTLASVIETYDRLGVDCCVTAPHPLLDGMFEKANDIAATAAAEWPGRIYGYISAGPGEGLEAIKRTIAKHMKNSAFVGFKFLGGYNGDYTEAEYRYALAAANEARCPVLCHTWDDVPALSTLRQMMEEFPNFKLVCAHLGGGGESATRRAAVMANEYEQFYLEICGSLHNTLSIADVIALVGAKKIIFGTDVLNLDARYDFGRVAFSPAADADKELIFAGNFLRLLKDSQMGKIHKKA